MSISRLWNKWLGRTVSAEAEAPSENDLVYIKNYLNVFEAEIAKGFLEGHGIGSIVSAEDVGGTRPMMMTVTGGARLLVRRNDVEDAKQLLNADADDFPRDGSAG